MSLTMTADTVGRCLHLELAQESGPSLMRRSPCLAQAAYSVQAFDWSGGNSREKEVVPKTLDPSGGDQVSATCDSRVLVC